VNETIVFDIDLLISGDPKISVYIDDVVMHGTTFEHTLDFGNHVLRIVHSGKTNHTPNQHVIIKSITIDGVDVRVMLWADSVCIPQYLEPWASEQQSRGIKLEERIIGETFLGHNCEWQLPFTSPFYECVMNHVR